MKRTIHDNLRRHPRCISGAKCVISVAGGGCYLSRLHPVPYCIPCYKAKWPDRKLTTEATDG